MQIIELINKYLYFDLSKIVCEYLIDLEYISETKIISTSIVDCCILNDLIYFLLDDPKKQKQYVYVIKYTEFIRDPKIKTIIESGQTINVGFCNIGIVCYNHLILFVSEYYIRVLDTKTNNSSYCTFDYHLKNMKSFVKIIDNKLYIAVDDKIFYCEIEKIIKNNNVTLSRYQVLQKDIFIEPIQQKIDRNVENLGYKLVKKYDDYVFTLRIKGFTKIWKIYKKYKMLDIKNNKKMKIKMFNL